MKKSSLYFFIIGLLLIISGCAKDEVLPGDSIIRETARKFDPEDGKIKIPFDVPQPDNTDTAKIGQAKDDKK